MPVSPSHLYCKHLFTKVCANSVNVFFLSLGSIPTFRLELVGSCELSFQNSEQQARLPWALRFVHPFRDCHSLICLLKLFSTFFIFLLCSSHFCLTSFWCREFLFVVIATILLIEEEPVVRHSCIAASAFPSFLSSQAFKDRNCISEFLFVSSCVCGFRLRLMFTESSYFF